MVEIASDPMPLPPPPVREQPAPMSKRKALLTTGIVIGILGAGLTAAGIRAYVAGKRDQEEEERQCRANPAAFCGLLSDLHTLPGQALLGAGVPALAAGVVLTGVGLGTHK